MEPVKRRAFLDGELIERQVLGGFRDRVLQFVGPHPRRLVGARIDQVERVALEGGAGDRDRLERLARSVQPAQGFQRRIVERLHAERDAIDAGRAIALEARRLHAGRVGLQRHLDIRRHAPVFRDGVENAAHRLRLHQRRRAAAEEDRRHLLRRDARGGGLDLAREGADIAVFVDRGVADMAVEVAIRALRQAERPVDIDAEGVGCISALQGTTPRV